jgi:hypothetical protein
MISWTTARNLDFEKVCSSSTLSTFESVAFGADLIIDGTSTFFITTVTRQTSSTFEDSVGTTTNHAGTTIYNSSSSSRYQDEQNYTGGSTLGTSSASGSFSTVSPASTVGKQTSSAVQTTVNGSTTTQVAGSVAAWTYSTSESEGSTITDFVSTSSSANRTRTTTTALSKTSLATTTSGSTSGNVRDTVYLADSSEVLWVTPASAANSVALTAGATTAAQTTLSCIAQTQSLQSFNSTSSPITLASSRSTKSFAFASVRTTTVSRVGNVLFAVCPGQTTQLVFNVSSSTQTSATITASSQPSITHRNNTETHFALSFGETLPTRTDIMASASWIVSARTITATSATRSIDNLESATSCFGQTTRTLPTLGAKTAIAAAATMSVFASRGVAAGNESGVRYVGSGFDAYQTEDTFEGIVGPRTAYKGRSVNVVTVFPVTDSNRTQSGNSVTFVKEITESSTTTTSSASVGVDGSLWVQSVRSRTGLVGGSLGSGETAVIRMNSGVYKNQAGGTSWFAGNDTTFTGSIASSYWFPVSYLEPEIANNAQIVFAVPRNTSTWPNA